MRDHRGLENVDDQIGELTLLRQKKGLMIPASNIPF